MNNDELLYNILVKLKKCKDFVFLWNGKPDKENYRSFLFLNPEDIISTYDYDNIKDCFYKIENALSKGYYVAGYLSYEAASAFENKLPKVSPQDFPLLWFGVYKNGDCTKFFALPAEGRRRQAKLGLSPFLKNRWPCLAGRQVSQFYNLKSTKNEKSYLSDIARIKDYIKKGDAYQVNYTFKYKFSFYGCPNKIFFDLNRKQSVPYSAFINFADKRILSISPELFLRRKVNLLEMKPMKGTIERGKDIYEDYKKQKQLETSAKNKAENLMIVDMIRNDLGRISKTASVKTVKLFETEKYQTLYQMTSTIKSKLKSNISWYDIFKAIFPSGSVTGAPKIRTMQIINELEKSPRNIYTGAIGYISPKKEAVFNVAIRTVLLDEVKKQGELGVGGGITISSDPKAELNECRLKAAFFTQQYIDFQSIETIAWQKGKFFLINLHLKRLKDSANYFNYKCSKDFILKSLMAHSKAFDKYKKYRIRLLLNKNGEIKISSSVLKSIGDTPQHKTARGHEKLFVQQSVPLHAKITFSKIKTNSSDIFLYHKTTNRKLYDDEYKKYNKKDFMDVIFLNQKNEITEGAISNIIIKNGKYYYTPPINSGLLNGIYRRYLLSSQAIPLKEKILHKKDIINADEVFICNSVRGLTKVAVG